MNERDKAREQAEIMLHWANGGEVEYSWIKDKNWTKCQFPTWNFGEYDYRIKGPYSELKEAAKDPTKQIRFLEGTWRDSDYTWEFNYPVENYGIRDKPKPMKNVKLWAWFNGAQLFWDVRDDLGRFGNKRVPTEDKEIKVEE